MSKRKLTYKDFKQYFSNNLQKKDKQAFEKQIMQDAFEEEAFDGLSKLSNNELEQDISELKIDINRRVIQTRRIIPVWFRYAASVIILIGIGTSIYLLNNRFWQDTMLKQQISEEMVIADSILLEAEKEILQFAEKMAKDTSVEIAEELIADNRKKEVEKTFKVVEDYIVIENDKMISDELVIDMDEAIEVEAILDMVEFEDEEEEIVYDEAEKVAENIVETEKAEQALQGKVSGLEIRGIAKSSVAGTRTKSKKKAEELIAEQEKEVTKRVITGKVLGAEDNLSIPGVSIVLEDNPSIGTTTNIDGEFALTIPDNDEDLKTLIAAFVGMETLEITIEGDTNILVYMESDVLEMDEVIVTAIGIKRDNADVYEIEKTEAKPSNSLGIVKYKKQLVKSLDYSKFSDFSGKHKIKLSFTVETSGKLSNFNFTKSPDAVFNKEIIRVMKEAGSWIPATENNQDIRSTVKLNIKIVVE